MFLKTGLEINYASRSKEEKWYLTESWGILLIYKQILENSLRGSNTKKKILCVLMLCSSSLVRCYDMVPQT